MIPSISSATHALGTSVGSIGSVGSVGKADASHPSSFGAELTSALGSLDHTQAAAGQAAQGLATGTISDPTQAVTSVENASLAMDVAAQIQNKLVSAETTIFQTQV